MINGRAKRCFVNEGLGLVTVPGWGRYAWLRHGFSTRVGGVSTGVRGGPI